MSMITANELRVGNRFIRELRNSRGLEYDHDFVLDEVAMGKLFSDNISLALQDLSPIPLTPELLEKIGFCEDDDCGFWHSRNEGAKFFTLNKYHAFPIKLKEGKFYYYFGCEDDEYSWDGKEITSLHQLQNLYFALTNTELKIEL